MELEVVQLTAVRIRAPITRMKTGTQVSWFVISFYCLKMLTCKLWPFWFGHLIMPPSLERFLLWVCHRCCRNTVLSVGKLQSWTYSKRNQDTFPLYTGLIFRNSGPAEAASFDMEKSSLIFLLFAVETFFLCTLKIDSVSVIARTTDAVQNIFL